MAARTLTSPAVHCPQSTAEDIVLIVSELATNAVRQVIAVITWTDR
ncbi:hypothetical protein ACFWUZ_28685 [Streptomyces sp. NPDC058646]